MPKRHPRELKERAARLYESGRTYLEVAAELGIGAMSVWRWVRETCVRTRDASEAAKLSPKLAAAGKKGMAAIRRTYCGTERHLANLAKVRETPAFKDGARRAAAIAREKARKTWVGSPDHLAHLAALHRRMEQQGEYRRISRLACHAKNTKPERMMRTLLQVLPEAEGFREQYLIDLHGSHTRADFAWPEKWLALYVDGPLHYRWQLNQVRDDRIARMLHCSGWKVIRIPDEMLRADSRACQRCVAVLLRAHRVVIISRRGGVPQPPVEQPVSRPVSSRQHAPIQAPSPAA